MRLSTLCTSALALALGATAANAQSTGGEAEGDLVVTGSRLGRTGFQTPTPVTVTSADQLQAVAPGNLSDGLNQLPMFKGSTLSGRVQGSGASGAGYLNLLNLRGIGPQRVLVLLDGRRTVSSSATGGVDINAFPQALVRRVDVVTGGASAAYGSDAVAGVVNFILDNRFEGLKGTVQAGISDYGDYDSQKVSLAGGTPFAGGRGHFVATAEYYRQSEITPYDVGGRSWYEHPYGLLVNPVTGGRPANFVASDIHLNNATFGGLITAGPLKGTAFGPGGTPYQFNFGTQTGGIFQVGGDGATAIVGIAPAQVRSNFFAHADYDFTDNLSGFVEATYSRNHSWNLSFYNYQLGSQFQYTIFNDNAYLPASVRQQMATAGITSFIMGRMSSDMPGYTTDSINELTRYSVGLRGNLGSWSWEANYSRSQSDQDQAARDITNNRNLYAAADAVRNAAGNIVCRSTLSGLDPGCIPLNLFGEGSVSKEAGDWVTGDSVRNLTLLQNDIAFSINGDLGQSLQFGAGPISVAMGVEYRTESADQDTDAVSQATTDFAGIRGGPAALQGRAGGFHSFNALPLKGDYNVKEAFFEIGVPLLRDLPLVKELIVDGGVRIADYSNSGAQYPWKVSASYRVVDDFRIRATRSEDIRGPNTNELFNAAMQNSNFVVINGVSTAVTQVAVGNPNLLPEKANTLTVGAVYEPSWLDGLSFSADYFSIDLSDAIAQLNGQQIVDECAGGSAALCALILRNGALTQIIRPSMNLQSLQTKGVDYEVAYRTAAFGGDLGLRLYASNILKYVSTAPGAVPLVLTGEVGATSNPKWSGAFQVDYRRGPFSLLLQERFIGSGKMIARFVEGVDIDRNDVDAVFYTDATLRWAFDTKMSPEAFLTINNLFNKEPPVSPSQPSTFQRGVNETLYDTLGRYFTAGLRFRM